MITLRQMRYFDALATTGHFRRAAELVNVSQPALSTQIAEMEKALGLALVDRGKGGAFLTTEGEDILPRIRKILEETDGLMAIVQGHRGLLEGRMRMGIIPTVAPYLLPVLIPLLREHYPELLLELKELMTASCLEELELGRLDCVIAALPVHQPGLVIADLFTDRFMIASATDENTILMSPMTEDNVDIERLLLLDEGHCLRDQALSVCGPTAGRRVANYGATSMATLLQMVSHGMGITLIPEIAVKDERERNRMQIVAFAEPQPYRTIGLVWRKTNCARQADFEALGEMVRQSAAVLLGGTEYP